MKSDSRTANVGAAAQCPIVRTFGELLPDGSMLELVAPEVGDQPDVLLWDGAKIRIAREIEHGGKLYRAEMLHPSILRATRLPREPVKYGTIGKLFADLAGTFEQRLAVSNSAAEQTTLWVFTTWFSEFLSSPPALWVSGADLGRAASYFGLLHCMCRRALKVTGFTRSGFLSLPSGFRPTLLINQPSLSVPMRNLCRETNYPGFVVPGSRGVVSDVSYSKAIFVGMAGATTRPSGENLHLPLFPADRELPPMDEGELTEIAEYFLPRLLQYRLHYARKVRESRFSEADLSIPTRALASKLAACVNGDPQLAPKVASVLLPQDDGTHVCNLDVAIVRVLWPRLHSSSTNRTDGSRVKIGSELTAEVNTLLLSCGEILQYSAEEVGIRVATLGLTRKRGGGGNRLLLDTATKRRIHEIARSYAICERIPGCELCQPIEKPETQAVQGMLGV